MVEFNAASELKSTRRCKDLSRQITGHIADSRLEDGGAEERGEVRGAARAKRDGWECDGGWPEAFGLCEDVVHEICAYGLVEEEDTESE